MGWEGFYVFQSKGNGIGSDSNDVIRRKKDGLIDDLSIVYERPEAVVGVDDLFSRDMKLSVLR